jgi:hypothetical protein
MLKLWDEVEDSNISCPEDANVLLPSVRKKINYLNQINPEYPN